MPLSSFPDPHGGQTQGGANGAEGDWTVRARLPPEAAKGQQVPHWAPGSLPDHLISQTCWEPEQTMHSYILTSVAETQNPGWGCSW